MGKFILISCAILGLVLMLSISQCNDESYCSSKGGLIVKGSWSRVCIKTETIPLPN